MNLNLHAYKHNVYGDFNMNYKRIYDEFIEYFKETKPRDRIYKRDKNDDRLHLDKIYVEMHHIIPRNEDGGNDPINLVALLPEEHLFIHFIRYRVFNNVNDILACNFMINGYNNKSNIHDVDISKIIRQKYSYIRGEFGKRMSVINKGSKAISNARKGTMPVKCIITDEIIGSVSTKHPKVLSGEWVHHSKGKVIGEDLLVGMRIRNTGSGNPRFSGWTDEGIIDKAIEMVDTLDGWSGDAWKKVSKDNNIPLHFTKFRFNGSISELRRIVFSKRPNISTKTLMWCHSVEVSENRLYIPSINMPKGWKKGENKKYARNYRV